MLMDISESLDRIIYKYGIDKYYPRYRNMRKARNIIHALEKEWAVKDRIACIVIGSTKEKRSLDQDNFAMCISTHSRHQVTFVQCSRRNGQRGLDTYEYSALEKISWKEFDKIYIISNCGTSYVGHWLRTHNIEYCSLYDILSLYDVCMDADFHQEWYDYIADDSESCFTYTKAHINPVSYELYEQKCRYESYREQELKSVALKKLIFLALVSKDFILAREYIEKLCEVDASAVRNYQDAWTEICLLIGEIKECLRIREKKDIVAFWIDGFSYEEALKKSSFISSLQDCTIWFENMITITGFTRETYRTLFTGKKLLDDETWNIKNINCENSILLSDIESMNYNMKLVTGFGHGTLFDYDYYPNDYLYSFDPGSIRLWEMIRQLTMNRGAVFLLVHLVETHHPYLFSGMDDACIFQMEKRKLPAYHKLDQCLKFYTDFLGSKATRIFFSDHGKEHWWPRQHVFLGIQGEDYSPKRIREMCTNLDFHKIVHNILHHKGISAEEFGREYAEVQGMPALKGDIEAIKKSGTMNSFYNISPPFSPYRGIVTEKYIYYCFPDGREWLASRSGLKKPILWFRREEDIFDESLLSYFRKLSGTENDEIDFGWKSDYYKKIELVRNHAMERNLRKIKYINDLFDKFGNQGIAIYGVGLPSRHLYFALEWNNRKKISCFIEDDAHNMCSNLSIPILSLENIKSWKNDVLVIVFSNRQVTISAEHIAFLKINKTINIYAWLERNGINCKKNFWDFEVFPEDFESL